MKAGQLYKALWASHITKLLQVVFTAILTMRFLFPFFYNPIDRLYSDMNRHVANGLHLLTPMYMNALDPKLYQVWMALLYQFPQKQARGFDALFTGLLCASMMWFWYKALREFTSRNKALLLASLLGIHLSLLTLYGFFLIETILLPVTALAVWMMLRAVRKRTLAAFTVCAACWVAAMFTKQTLIPVAILGIGYALYAQPQKWRSIAVTAALLVAAMIPAGWQSMQVLHIFAPFGFTDMQIIARKSHRTGYELHLTDSSKPQQSAQNYWWKPEALIANPFYPFPRYEVTRDNSPYIVHLDLADGQAGWNKVIAEIEKARSWQDILHEYEENAVYLFFSPSWPDGSYDPNGPMLIRWNTDLRWSWLPIFLIVMLGGPFVRMEPPKAWIVLIAFTISWAFLLQDVSIMEARYRKLVEPFLLLSVYFMVEAKLCPLTQKQTSLVDFVKEFYLAPLLQLMPKGKPV